MTTQLDVVEQQIAPTICLHCFTNQTTYKLNPSIRFYFLSSLISVKTFATWIALTIILCHPDFCRPVEGQVIGYASQNGGTTGGGNAAPVIVSSKAEFITAATVNNNAAVIKVQGTFDVGEVEIRSNKTIEGIGATAGLTGNLRLKKASNIIIRNLSISNPSNVGEKDSITVQEGTTNVWIDHNNIFNSTDGLLDITRESDFVTVSWNKFYYTADFAANENTNHRFAMLIGNTDNTTEDDFHVTLHHNYWAENVFERMPRVRYGDVHVFNNYYNSQNNNYANRAAIGAEMLIENNYFEKVNNPYEKFPNGLLVSDPLYPRIEANGNFLVGTTGTTTAGDNVFDPPYNYTLDNGADVKNIVVNGAGVGINSVPEPAATGSLCLLTIGLSTRRRRHVSCN